MKTQHTPTPWETTHDLNDTYHTQIWNAATETLVADCDMLNGQTAKTSQANAAFIVKACNSHYELLEAAKTLLANAEFQDGQGIILTHDAEALETAITKAEGEAV